MSVIIVILILYTLTFLPLIPVLMNPHKDNSNNYRPHMKDDFLENLRAGIRCGIIMGIESLWKTTGVGRVYQD